ncbi:MAG TPA: peptide chain release factor 1 [Clostridia bacterium]|jgi:peptide chain release factor 1|nr:peptide chain release factor 1 [Clostridia bacterium]HQC68183.1 peptide chain release factor 1 [Clostridia bacterium]
MLGKLKEIEIKYEDISRQLTDPAVISDQEQYVALMKELNGISEIVKVYREYVQTAKEIDDIYIMLKENSDDADFKQLLQEELAQLEEKKPALEQQLKILLLPVDPNDTKNVIIEIRGGAGGDEAALFAADLLRMYTMYAEAKKWKTEILDLNEIGIGGIKEVVFSITGQGAYSRFKYESGVHRVQRVPETESQGRIHTSTVTVAVLPEAEEVDVEINMNDVQIDTYRSSGAGGQHVNKTDSAIRLTHIPTGIVVACQDERSQHKNRDKAFKILRSKLYEIAQENQDKEIAENRKSQVGTGDRSERIRTYNFPQGRVTDHRIGLTLYKIEAVMNGDLDELMDALITEDQARKLLSQNEQD